MAATVQSLIGGGSGGADLSELTSGEKAFIGLLFMPITLDGCTGGGGAFIGGTFAYVHWDGPVGRDVYNMSLDLSKIASVYFFSNNSNGLSMCWVNADGNNIGDISANKDGVNSVPPSDAKGIRISTGWVDHIEVQLTSFTTADGKVHTVDNLNY